MINTASLKRHIRFTLEHHGTRTQGEDFRFDQVTEYLVEMIILIQAYEQAMDQVTKEHPNQSYLFSLSIG